MKSILYILLFSLVFNLYDIEKHKKIVYYVNKLRTTWKAKLYDFDISPLLGAWEETESTQLQERTVFKASQVSLPDNFDLRDEYPNCESIGEIRDQSRCGSCWAFGAAETMSDRICIHSGGQLQTRVSAAHLTTCCTACGNGCNGGYPSVAFTYWKNTGIPSGGLYGDTTTCKPYFFPPCDDHPHKCEDYEETPECEAECQEGYPKTLEEDKSYAESAYSVKGEENMMQEIYENGPIESTFLVYEDFNDYESGVYQHITGEAAGMHAVKIIGWGVTDTGIKYWLIANSWNEKWGEKGFFRMIRGENECGIESLAATGIPKF